VYFEDSGYLFSNTSDFDINASIHPASDVNIRANAVDSGQGSIFVMGQGPIEMHAVNGIIDLYDGPLGIRIGYFSETQFDVPGQIHMDGGILLMSEAGVDRNQDIQFRDGGVANGERFQWDDAADRFEVSNDFHAFGQLSADIKNFVQNHPTRPDLEVVYTVLEGDEATVYTRGYGRLVDGRAEVALGETFALVANPDLGLSAHLTPRGRLGRRLPRVPRRHRLGLRRVPAAGRRVDHGDRHG
jgi:hypothetical protein